MLSVRPVELRRCCTLRRRLLYVTVGFSDLTDCNGGFCSCELTGNG